MHTHFGLMSKRHLAACLIALTVAAAPSRAADGEPRDKSSPEDSVGVKSVGDSIADGGSNAEKLRAADPASPITVELEELKAAVQAQTQVFAEHSKELESEREALRDELNAIQRLEARLGALDGNAPVPAMAAVQPAIGVTPAPRAQQNDQTAPVTTQPINVVTVPNPYSIKIGGADFTPGGFIDLTGIFRSTNDGTSGLSTNLSSIPFNSTLPQGQLSEFRFTSQGSRLSLKVDANISHSTAATAYVESDFNGYEPANAEASTKSDTLRLRLAWAQIRHGRWEVLTGQAWSLLTPTRVGLSPLPENIFTALRLDTSYLAGMVYARQPGVRFTYRPNSWSAFAIALENPDQFVPSSVTFPNDGATNFFSTQFDNGSSNTSATSATSNTAAPNLHPDIIVKTAFDRTLAGKALHVDIGGVARSFKDFSNLSVPRATDTIVEGAGQFNAIFEVFKGFHLIGNAFYGEGGGRYVGALGPDVVVKPDGTLSPVRSGSAIFGYEWQLTPQLVVDGYYSGAYFWRNYRTTTSALGAPCGSVSAFCVGFGFPGSANSDNKDYQEATIGLTPTIWSSPNYGRLQFISQFSYIVLAPWYVPSGNPKNAHAFISFVNLRYIIP